MEEEDEEEGEEEEKEVIECSQATTQLTIQCLISIFLILLKFSLSVICLL